MNIKFEELKNADLIIDAIYEGGTLGNLSDDVLSKLMFCENSGGFRKRGSVNPFELNYVVVYSTGEDLDWMDTIDLETGRVKYHGDNKSPGRELHDTPKKGNEILRECFKLLNSGLRNKIPPFFLFTRADGRNVRFRGLMIPGDPRLKPDEQLVALWSSKGGNRFQNYRAYFTLLDVSKIEKSWLIDLINGQGYESRYAPEVWRKWVQRGIYKPLMAKQTVEYRTKEEQLPANRNEIEIIKTIYEYFENGYSFESCAAQIAQLMDKNIISYELTQAVRDGGRDCIGKYRIGLPQNGVFVDFALEAKRYDFENSVGVKEVSRLISRLKFREFGILVTTSFVGLQAYKELKEDRHPVIIISAKDIVEILNEAGYKTKVEVQNWLESNFKRS